MKNLKINISNFKVHMTAALLLCLAASGAYAQTLVTPSSGNNLWYSTAGSGYPLLGLNTAMLAYGSTLSPSYVFASTYYDNSGAEHIYFNDPFNGGLTANCASNTGYNSIPDLIVGDNKSYPGTSNVKYFLATAFVHNSNVYVEFYNVNYVSGVLSSISYSGTTVTISSYLPHIVHIDVMADATKTGYTGFGLCDKFVVTWDDFTDNAHPNVYAREGALNGYSLPAGNILISTDAYAPDVAAIFDGNASGDEEGLVTYVGTGGNTLYLGGYDFSAATPLGTTTLDAGTYSNSISLPRIDADDDYITNATTIPPVATYMVVAQVDSSSGYTGVRTYSALTSPTYWPSSAYVDVEGQPGLSADTPPYNHYAPTVAYGPLDYLVSHFTEYAASADALFMGPINSGTYNAFDGGKYYWENGSGTPPAGVNAYDCSYANSVSATANRVTDFSVTAWGQKDAGPAYDVYYKVTGWPFAYKHTPAAVTNVQEQQWQVYPNPAANALIVRNTGTANAATDYCIMDVAGRMLLKGSLQAGNTNIDVSRLAAGTYVLKVYKDEGDDGNELFVKN